MNLQFSRADEIFRDGIRRFVREHLPADIARRAAQGFHPPPRADTHVWNRILFEKGWSAPHWPIEHCGTGWNALRRHLFEEECYQAGAPELSWQGLRLVGPVLYTFGSEAQKKRYLRGIRSGDEYWVQGFSEPGAGSDLVALKTTAVLDGDRYIVNGQKIWSSEAQFADMGFFLVKTDTTVKPQRGISFLLIDMKTPGITVRPITLIDGGPEVNEIFLDNVVVPAENLVGEAGQGWSYAKALFENERTSGAHLHTIRRELDKLKRIATRELCNGVPLIEQPAFSRAVAEVDVAALALEWSVLRVLANEKSAYDANARASALKVRGAMLYQRVTELQIDALGLRSLRLFDPDTAAAASGEDACEPWPGYIPGLMAGHLFGRAIPIAGGTNEVQKNIIAKLAFGL